VRDQREYYKLYEQNQPSPFSASRFQQLQSLGLTINRWEKRLEELRLFKERHGHCDVPLDHPHLGVWVLNQRDAYHYERESMPRDRIDALEGLGFNWNRWGRNRLKIREDAWEAQFTKLLEFIKVHGHSNISQHDKENERLGKWIKNQRYEYRKYHNKGLGPSRLGRDRIERLEAIGFQWRLRPERIPWDDRFQSLVEFKKQYGHCRVPMTVPELGKWAKYQRDQFAQFMRGKKAKINQDKIDKLLSIGFEDSLEERVILGIGQDGEGMEQETVDVNGGGGGGGATATHHHHHHPTRGELEHHHAPPQQQEEVTTTEVAWHNHAEQPAHAHAVAQQQQQHHVAAAAQQQHTGQLLGEQHGGHVYAEQYHHGDAGHPYVVGTQQGSGTAYSYTHGAVHYN